MVRRGGTSHSIICGRRRHRIGAIVATASLCGALFSVGVLSTEAASASTVNVPCAVSSLIGAINAANTAGSGTLQLATGCTYTLVTADNPTDGGNGLPVLQGQITINGGAGTKIVRSSRPGTPDFRIFEVAKGATVAITGLTITGGKIGGTDGGGGLFNNEGTISNLSHDSISSNSAPLGGGIDNFGTVATLSNDVISHNSSVGLYNAGKITTMRNDLVSENLGGAGAGVDNNGGTIGILSQSIISGNRLTADGAGGGIANNFGTIHMNNDVVSNNAATGGALASGGGIVNSGLLTLTNSVVRDNVARGVGGGIKNEAQVSPELKMVVQSSTIVHNTVTSPTGPANGGGVSNLGELSLTGSAVLQNVANVPVGRAVGAGIYNDASLSLSTTAVSANLASDAAGEAEGGGIYVDEQATKTALLNSPVISNRATGAHPNGGGIFFNAAVPVSLVNSPVVANQPNNCFPPGSVTGCHG